MTYSDEANQKINFVIIKYPLHFLFFFSHSLINLYDFQKYIKYRDEWYIFKRWCMTPHFAVIMTLIFISKCRIFMPSKYVRILWSVAGISQSLR